MYIQRKHADNEGFLADGQEFLPDPDEGNGVMDSSSIRHRVYDLF